jgi:hypothetical protein
MFCEKCGTKIDEGESTCPHCGARVEKEIPVAVEAPPRYEAAPVPGKMVEEDGPSTGYNILAFLIPIVGFVLWVIWGSQLPIRSKGIIKWTLISIGITVFLRILVFFWRISLGLY